MTTDRLRDAVARLVNLLSPYATLPAAARLVSRLEEAAASAGDQPGPVVAALVGGTGVGKSRLLNALAGVRGLSPVSDDLRPCTRRPVVARHPADAPLLPPPLAEDAVAADWPHQGLALADAPDLDSVEPANREAARRVIACADIIIYVCDPDKVSNLDLLAEVRAWALKKRWLFVLNKTDLLPDAAQREKSLAQMGARLAERGFDAPLEHAFAVSAAEPADKGLAALAEALLGRAAARGLHTVLAADALLGRLLAACDPRLIEELTRAAARLDRVQGELLAGLRQSLSRELDSGELYPVLAPILRRNLWAQLPYQARGPLSLVLGLHARLAGISSAWQVWRLLSRGVSLTRLFKFGLSFWSVVRGTYDLEQLAGRLAERLAADFADLERRATLALEDAGVYLTAGEEPEAGDPWREVFDEMREVPLLGKGAANLASKVRNLAGRQDRQQALVMTVLARTMDAAGARLGRGLVRWYDEILACLPLPFLGHMLYILGRRWWEGQWLSFEFYPHALLLFLLLWLPSYGLVLAKTARRVKRRSLEGQLAQVIEAVPPAGPLARLTGARRDLAEAAEGLTALSKEARALRAARAAEARLDDFATARS